MKPDVFVCNIVGEVILYSRITKKALLSGMLFWCREPGSNWRHMVLQTIALPLSYPGACKAYPSLAISGVIGSVGLTVLFSTIRPYLPLP